MIAVRSCHAWAEIPVLVNVLSTGRGIQTFWLRTVPQKGLWLRSALHGKQKRGASAPHLRRGTELAFRHRGRGKYTRLPFAAGSISADVSTALVYSIDLDNMAAVRASTRVSIAWKGQDSYEDTDTLVLTIHDYSLDLRVFISGQQKGQIDWSTVAKVSELEGSTKGQYIFRLDLM